MKFLRRTVTFPEKEFQEEMERIDSLVVELQRALAEALDWIERPVATAEDAEYFMQFEEHAHRLLGE